MKKNIWINLPDHEEIYYGQYVVPNFVSASIALKISEKEFVLLSPGASMLEAWPSEFKGSDISVSIIFPNSFHHLGVEAWLSSFSNVSLYASKKAARRLNKIGFEDVIHLEESQPELPAGYEVVIPPGHRGGDVWLCKEADAENGSVWITCDSFLNYDRVSNRPIARAMQYIMDAAPGLKISRVISNFLIDDKRQFRPWLLSRLDQDRPTTLIPSHGEIARNERLYVELAELALDKL